MAKISTSVQSTFDVTEPFLTYVNGANATGGRGRLPSPPAGSTAKPAITTAFPYELTGSSVTVEVLSVQTGPFTVDCESKIIRDGDSQNYLSLLVNAGTNLKARRRINAVTTDMAGVTYDPVAHRFWRIRESAGTVYYELSPNRTTWTVLDSFASPSWTGTIIWSALGGSYATDKTALGEFTIDNLNTDGAGSVQPQTSQPAPAVVTPLAPKPPGGTNVLRDRVLVPLIETRDSRPYTGPFTRPPPFNRLKHATGETGIIARHNCRSSHETLFDGFAPAFTFSNFRAIEVASNPAFTLTASLELPGSDGGGTGFGGSGSAAQTSSTIIPMRFRGESSVVLNPGQLVTSDPLYLDLRAGQRYFVRTSRTPVGGDARIVTMRTGTVASWLDASSTSIEDLTLPGTTISGNTSGMYGPIYAEATPARGERRTVVCGTGDSIMEATGTGTSLFGWFDYTLTTAGIAHYKLSMSGEQGTQFYGNGFINGVTGQRYRGLLLSGATEIVDEYGANDVNSSVELATLQAYVLRAASKAALLGARYHKTTLTPKTSSTDGWTTVENQTPVYGGEVAVRLPFNAWLLDGAPISTTTRKAVAVGTAGAIRAGQVTHPIAGIINFLPLEVTKSNGDRVWTPDAYTTDGWHPGGSGNNIMSAIFGEYISRNIRLLAP